MYDREKVNINPFQQHAKNSPKYAYHNWGELRNYSDIPRKGGLTVAKQKELIHGYWAAVSYSDAQVGKVIDKLEELGVADNTIVVLWGDHGWHLGDHGLWCKHSNFEQATKAPLIVVAPGYSQGKSAYTMAEFVDIFPTLIDYAGFEIPENLEGNSLLPALQDAQVEIKDYAVSQFPRGKDILGYSIRTKRYRLTLWLKGEFEHVDLFKDPVIEAVELYDYEKDPAEQVSLADNSEYSKVVEELKIKLLTLLNEQVE
jgi:arylsulfatase A-like enzyme